MFEAEVCPRVRPEEFPVIGVNAQYMRFSMCNKNGAFRKPYQLWGAVSGLLSLARAGPDQVPVKRSNATILFFVPPGVVYNLSPSTTIVSL
jgi:hypothetical protein